jgi:hypothetical protein
MRTAAEDESDGAGFTTEPHKPTHLNLERKEAQMRITKITVSASRKVPHPIEEFASLSALVSLEAEMSQEDDAGRCIVKLQGDAEELVEKHLRKVAIAIAARDRLERAAKKAQEATAIKAKALVEKHGEKF